MKKVLAIVFLLCIVGCAANQQFVLAMDDAAKVIGPEYLMYLRADKSLSPETIATRERTVELLFITIEQAKEE